jgi:hypothetical protein
MSPGEKYDRGLRAGRRKIEKSLRHTGASWNIDNSLLRRFPKSQLGRADLNSKQEIPEPPLHIASD